MDLRGLHSTEGHCYFQYSQLYSTSFEITNWIDNLFTIFCSHITSTNGSPPKTTNIAPTDGLFGLQQCPEDNLEASDYNAGNTLSKGTPFGQPPNRFHPPPWYCYPPSQPPFPGAPQFYHPTPFNMTPSLQLRSGATPGYQSYGPQWQCYNFPQSYYSGPQMIPPPQFTGQGPPSPAAPQEPPALPANHPVISPTLSASTPYG